MRTIFLMLLAFILLVNCLWASNVAAADPAPDLTNKLEGFGFGLGISLTVDTGKHKRVESASVVNGIVRIDEDNNDVPRVMLESHYFFLPGKDKTTGKAMFGIGPFVAVQPGGNNVIDAVGMGVMVGFKREPQNISNSSSWNFGVGMVVDPSVKVLGDGIEENKPLPSGETNVRLKKTAQWGVLLITSYAF